MKTLERVSTARVSTKGLTIGYRRTVPVLSGLSLEVQGPGVFRIDGPNGIGKSTLLEALAGYLAPLEGSVNVGGVDVIPGRRVPGLRLQRSEPAFVPGVTIRDHLHLYSRRYGVDLRDTLALAGRLQLEAHLDKVPESLSTGTLKKAWFLCNWVGQERVWCLDEAFNGVDAESCMLMSELVMARGVDGLVLLVSHLMPPGLTWGRPVVLPTAHSLLVQEVEHA